MTALKKYKGYTLMEMIVVMGMIILISAIGFGSFYGLRDTVLLNENLTSLAQSVRNAQRSSLFLDRGFDERWIYGIGVDFSQLTASQQYNSFKLCSQFNEYGDTRTRNAIPNFDKSLPVSTQNGNLFGNGGNTYDYNNCDKDIYVSELVKIIGTTDDTFEAAFDISFPETNNASGDVGEVPVYVLFESVSGRAFFYDASGNIVNYNSEGKPVADPINLVFEIQNPSSNILKIITVSNISGKVSVESSTY